jgi:hypothetical protein
LPLTTVPVAELLWLASAVMAAGVVTGILAGLFGIGGGAVIVPVLYELFRIFQVPEEVRMQLCVGTSLAIIVPTTVRSYRTSPRSCGCGPCRRSSASRSARSRRHSRPPACSRSPSP